MKRKMKTRKMKTRKKRKMKRWKRRKRDQDEDQERWRRIERDLQEGRNAEDEEKKRRVGNERQFVCRLDPTAMQRDRKRTNQKRNQDKDSS